MEKEKIESIIESLLFVSGEPVSFNRLCSVISEAGRSEVKAALEAVIARWENPARGLRVVEVAGGYQFQTPPENAAWVGRLLESRPVRLSRAALETLAIIAYRQPITRPEIEELRGVDSGGVLKTLLEYGFIKIAGRKEVPGKPLIYATDKRFMEFFRLKSLSDLPTLKEMAEIHDQRLQETGEESLLPLQEEEKETRQEEKEEEQSREATESPPEPSPEE